MTQFDAVDGCLLCQMEEVDEDRVIFRDDRWAAEVVPGYDVPGWIVLRVRRHAERLLGLDEHELETLGVRARDVTRAVGEATGAATAYLMVFGENHRHFHALITARGEDVPEDRRSGDVLKLRLGAGRPGRGGGARPLVAGGLSPGGGRPTAVGASPAKQRVEARAPRRLSPGLRRGLG